MKSLGFSRNALTSCAAAALLAGCGRSEPPLGAPTTTVHTVRQSGGSAKPKRGLVYAADDGSYGYDSKILIFSENRGNSRAIGEITAGVNSPWGLSVDRQGNLYVANDDGTPPTVSVYARDSSTPSMVYFGGLDHPMYPIVDRDGNLFVSNSFGGGIVVEYLHGITTPYRILHTGGTETDGMDFEQQGNLYVAYRNHGYNGTIDEFAPGSTQGRVLGMQLEQPQGLVLTETGTILVVETGSASRIDEFLPGSLTPVHTLRLPQTPTQLAIDRAQKKLFVSSAGDIYLTRYPALDDLHITVSLRKHKHRQDVQGVAISNGQSF